MNINQVDGNMATVIDIANSSAIPLTQGAWPKYDTFDSRQWLDVALMGYVLAISWKYSKCFSVLPIRSLRKQIYDARFHLSSHYRLTHSISKYLCLFLPEYEEYQKRLELDIVQLQEHLSKSKEVSLQFCHLPISTILSVSSSLSHHNFQTEKGENFSIPCSCCVTVQRITHGYLCIPLLYTFCSQTPITGYIPVMGYMVRARSPLTSQCNSQ